MRITAKKIHGLFYLVLFILLIVFVLQRNREIRLIVRGDDMGFSHAVNLACIKAYQEGILTSVDVMVPCDYFDEAVEMLKENPGLDVGIHLTLNSEWENIKWGPITDAPSLVDENGHFFQMTWPDAAHPPDNALGTASWQLDEIEQELRAQIELIKAKLPNCSHATPHMGFHSISPQIMRLTASLMREYDIDANLRMLPLKEVSLFGDADTVEDMVQNAASVLENLGPGTWQFYDHPGMLIDGEEAHWHIGAEDDAAYRVKVTEALTDERLKQVIARRNIKLIGYDDLQPWH